FTSTPLPPYASLDMLAGQEAKTSYTDVLANDHDANGDTLTINTFDSTSRLGGTVSRSVGTGPGGRDELAYTPAAHSITGTSVVDSFLYEVIDPDDQTQTGVAMVYVDAISLAAYWPLDEGTGSSSEDLTANDNDLTISNADNVTWGTGKFDDCLEFDSTSESAYCSSRDQLGSISVSAWVKCDASGVNTWRRAVAQGYYATGWQLGVTSDNKAEFSVTEDAYILRALNGTTTLTAGVWYHLVGVYDIVNDEVRLYVDTDEEDSEAITATSLGHLQSSGVFRIGSCDDGNGFWGSIDDVRLYSHALTLSEINDVFNAEVAASEPDPHDFEEGANVNAVLSWVTSATMTEHDVYIGTNETSVTNATTASIVEYKGRQTATTYNPALSVETTYYWRIDEVNGSGVYTGDVWQFTTGPLLDEPADLDLTNVFKAINFGVTTDQTIGSTVFLASTFNTTVDGVTNTGGGAIPSGVVTDAVIGDTDDDNALEEILSASVYNGVDIDIP
ncbi:MAG: LamG domain-containing protein, partial [bacterium]|nr:LamG domain-containing protein [bacterium]